MEIWPKCVWHDDFLTMCNEIGTEFVLVGELQYRRNFSTLFSVTFVVINLFSFTVKRQLFV